MCNFFSRECGCKLRAALASAYEARDRKSYEDQVNNGYFVVDDRGHYDYYDETPKRRLSPHFCGVAVSVIDNNTVSIMLRGRIPWSRRVTYWLKLRDAYTERGYVNFLIRNGEESELAELAAHLLSPRVAATIDRLRKVLGEFWANYQPSERG
jgi:hypothetical protein